MGFVRVSGYNEEDLNNARKEGGTGVAVSSTPDHIGVSTIAYNGKQGSTSFSYKFYPEKSNSGNFQFTSSESTVTYYFVLSSNDGNLQKGSACGVEVMTQSEGTFHSIRNVASYNGKQIFKSSDDGTMGVMGLFWGVVRVPAGCCIRVKAKSYLEEENLITSATAHAFIEDVQSSGDSEDGGDATFDPPETIWDLPVAQGRELMALIDASSEADGLAKAEKIASDVGITLVEYSYGVATYTTEYQTMDDLREVIAYARTFGYTLSINSVTSLDPSPFNPFAGDDLGGGGV